MHIVVSDLHLGSPFFQHEAFRTFLHALPDGTELVLAGDTIDNPKRELPDSAQCALRELVRTSHRLPVVWVEGNHDESYIPESCGEISFAQSHVIDQRVFVAHGSHFDNVMPRSRWFIKTFKFMHTVRVRLGARPVHVAQYAKKWKPLYAFLRHCVRQNAVEHAREHGYDTAVCGHVHFAEETRVEGVHYFNTGSWVEPDLCYVLVRDGRARLIRYDPSDPVPPE